MILTKQINTDDFVFSELFLVRKLISNYFYSDGKKINRFHSALSSTYFQEA